MSYEYILNDLYTRFTSRKVIAIVLAIGLTLARQYGFNIDQAILDRIIALCISYLAVEGARDAIAASK